MSYSRIPIKQFRARLYIWNIQNKFYYPFSSCLHLIRISRQWHCQRTLSFILINLTGAMIHFCQVRVSKYKWEVKSNLSLLFFNIKWEPRPWAEVTARQDVAMGTNTCEEVSSGLGPCGCRDLCCQSVGGRDDRRSSNVRQRL